MLLEPLIYFLWEEPAINKSGESLLHALDKDFLPREMRSESCQGCKGEPFDDVSHDMLDI